MELHKGDCLEIMPTLPDNSIDLVLTDPPYGTTACKWDSVIPFEPMWKELKRIAKPTAAIVLFGSQPFTSALVMSNPKMFRYEWVWQKSRACNFNSVKFQPLKMHEAVCVFSATTHQYFPIKEPKTGASLERALYPYKTGKRSDHFSSQEKGFRDVKKYPSACLKFNNEVGLHPTQKPVELLRYLIRTYTQEGETVLDFTMGSGSTGVACKLEGRDFIGIERDEKYFEIAKERIEGSATLF